MTVQVTSHCQKLPLVSLTEEGWRQTYSSVAECATYRSLIDGSWESRRGDGEGHENCEDSRRLHFGDLLVLGTESPKS